MQANEILEIVKTYFPDARVSVCDTNGDPRVRERFFISKRNKGSFSIEGIQYRIKQEKIRIIVDALKVEAYQSKTSNSAYFEYNGHEIRISDHNPNAEFKGINYLINLHTDEKEIINNIKQLTNH